MNQNALSAASLQWLLHEHAASVKLTDEKLQEFDRAVVATKSWFDQYLVALRENEFGTSIMKDILQTPARMTSLSTLSGATTIRKIADFSSLASYKPSLGSTFSTLLKQDASNQERYSTATNSTEVSGKVSTAPTQQPLRESTIMEESGEVFAEYVSQLRQKIMAKRDSAVSVTREETRKVGDTSAHLETVTEEENSPKRLKLSVGEKPQFIHPPKLKASSDIDSSKVKKEEIYVDLVDTEVVASKVSKPVLLSESSETHPETEAKQELLCQQANGPFTEQHNEVGQDGLVLEKNSPNQPTTLIPRPKKQSFGFDRPTSTEIPAESDSANQHSLTIRTPEEIIKEDEKPQQNALSDEAKAKKKLIQEKSEQRRLLLESSYASKPSPSTTQVQTLGLSSVSNPAPVQKGTVSTLVTAGTNSSPMDQHSEVASSPKLDPSETTVVKYNGEYILPESSEESSDEEQVPPPKVNLPKWTHSPALRELLRKQSEKDPDSIFGEVRPPKMEDIFKGSNVKRFRPRTSSANWSRDQLTIVETETYAKQMGFKKQ